MFSYKINRLYYVIGWCVPVVMTTAWAIVTANFLDSECWTGYAWTNYYWILEGPRMAIIAVIYIAHMHIYRYYYLYQLYVWMYHINIYVDVTGYSWQLRRCKILTVKTCGQINHGQLLFFFMFVTSHLNECW